MGPPEGSGVSETSRRQHVLTVNLEDYYQVGAFNRLIQRGRWYRFETRVETGTRRALDLLDAFGIRATFFVLGYVADELPELVRTVAARGHELASKGYYHRNIRDLTPSEFRADLVRAREAIEKASGRRVVGYRVADQWFRPPDLWAMEVLAEEGYEYDSSIGPMFREFAAQPWRRFAHQHALPNHVLWEFPISTASIFGWLVPIAGGNYFRQFPHALIRHAVQYWDRTYQSPFVMYFHTWELDPDQPRIHSAPLLTRVRHYRHLSRMPDILRYYFGAYRFGSIADCLAAMDAASRGGLEADSSGGSVAGIASARREATPQRARRRITLVVPCYNEESALPYLANTLRSVETSLRAAYELHLLFVDDCSTDGTWDALHSIFEPWPNCTFVRHERNQGVAVAIHTGIAHAGTEIVCSVDCDCTYDPHELREMIPLLADDVDLVVASPYHPDGRVENVPGWRLFLSKSASAFYRRIMRQKLYTYTSCFRVYRRSAVSRIELEHAGFLGIPELIGKLDLTGSRVVEFPTTLEARLLGYSKMKVARTIAGHLRLLGNLLRLRFFGGFPGSGRPDRGHAVLAFICTLPLAG
jgi:polysaccharide deacetylase family protein (PEP-CTERM system associated)